MSSTENVAMRIPLSFYRDLIKIGENDQFVTGREPENVARRIGIPVFVFSSEEDSKAKPIPSSWEQILEFSSSRITSIVSDLKIVCYENEPYVVLDGDGSCCLVARVKHFDLDA